MSLKSEWSPEDLQKLRRAMEYHGRLDNRVVDDLADSMGRTPQSIKAKARQLRAREKSGQPIPEQNIQTTDDSLSSLHRPQASEETVIPNDQPDELVAVDVPKRTKRPGGASYTELIVSLEQLDKMITNLKRLQARYNELAKELDQANGQVVRTRDTLLKRFPEAKGLVDKLF